MYCTQELMQPVKAQESSCKCHEMPPLFKSTPNLKTPPLFQSCQLVCSKCCVPKVNQPTTGIGDSILNTMSLAPPTIEDLLLSLLSKFITFVANNYRYSATFTEIFVTACHPCFLKTKSEANKEDNPEQHQAPNGTFLYKYWKVAEKEISTLEAMVAWQ